MVKQTKIPPVIGFSAYRGAGKTTLLKKVIALLRKRDIRVAVIKHASYDFDIDHPGKDSFELRKADTYQLLVSSGKRKALITELESYQPEPVLSDLIDDLDHENIDLILVEGYKREHFAKIEIYRQDLNKPYLYVDDADIIAVVTESPLPDLQNVTVLDVNRPETIADFIFQLVY